MKGTAVHFYIIKGDSLMHYSHLYFQTFCALFVFLFFILSVPALFFLLCINIFAFLSKEHE